LTEQWDLKAYSNKISIAPKHFLDFDTFKLTKNLAIRDNLIGYVGRFSNEKGIINFVESIPYILKRRTDVHFLLIGDGVLKNEIEQYVQKHNLTEKVEIKKWVQHNELPFYLNSLKLVVIPSYTEGLPNLMLEAMACGTPVVATSVGSIPDFVKNSETGFIMENNSPDCIAKSIINALEESDLNRVSERARIVIEQSFTFEKAVDRYENIIKNI
jgi:glycosyltransferase involved in cell wall biosynthesis